MAESEIDISDFFDDMDLEETYGTGYKKDVEVEIIDGFYYQNVAFMNDKVRLFAKYLMKLYSNRCLQIFSMTWVCKRPMTRVMRNTLRLKSLTVFTTKKWLL